MTIIPLSVKVTNYKCFGDEPQGFEVLKPINIIIGRNNSGKSALLDMVQQACKKTPEFNPQDCPPGKSATLVYSAEIEEEIAKYVFPPGVQSGNVRGDNSWVAGRKYLGRRITFSQTNGPQNNQRAMHIPEIGNMFSSADGQRLMEANLENHLRDPLTSRPFRRLAAERDVTPEGHSGEIDPQPSGRNVTSLIHNVSNKATFDRSLIDVSLLQALNEIIEPDYSFSAILSRLRDDNRWELFLQEEHKGLIALSASGSGLKTILCVLANITVLPKVGNKTLGNFVFGFEELENSLHPALLRRLLLYLRRRILAENGLIFLTTHSNVAIDMFATDGNAQIIHTVHRAGEPARAIVVSEYLHRRNILDDIDVRASDLLQSNDVVWVEGPSDRTYINHWIGLLTKNELREGTHYQCVFYGGKLLAHLSAEAPDETEAFVSIFRVNRNAAVIIDSDRKREDDELSVTKLRIIEEIQRQGGFAWVTSGREIENYLPVESINAAAEVQSGKSLERFQDIRDYLEAEQQGKGKKFERGKTEFAARIIANIDLESQSAILDWKSRVTELCQHIRDWNKMPP